MLRDLQTGQRKGAAAWWVRALLLLCVSLVTMAGTTQACHAHEELRSPEKRQTQLVAPAQDCAWCAATQAAMPAQAMVTDVAMPEAARTRAFRQVWIARELWNVERFGRPPPACPGHMCGGQAEQTLGGLVRTNATG